MCDICDGMTYDEVLASTEASIRQRGWTTYAVEGEGRHRPFAHTLGLSQTFGAPELVMVGACRHCAIVAFDELVEGGFATAWGADPPAQTRARGQRFGVVTVHPSQWTTHRFGHWWQHRAAYPHDGEVRAVQLLFPDEQGVLPTEQGVDPRVKRAQTRLDRAVVADRAPARHRARRRRGR